LNFFCLFFLVFSFVSFSVLSLCLFWKIITNNLNRMRMSKKKIKRDTEMEMFENRKAKELM
jgi:hypothetical protein